MNQLDDLLWELAALPVFATVRKLCPRFSGEADWGPSLDMAEWLVATQKAFSGEVDWEPSLDMAEWLVATQTAFNGLTLEEANWDKDKHRYTAFVAEIDNGHKDCKGEVVPDPFLALLTAIKAAVKHEGDNQR